MKQQALQLITQYDTIIIHRHTHPDGDAVGSQVGLKHLLLANFPTKTVYTVGDAAGRYAFVADSDTDQVADEVFAHALCIVLDTSAHALVSDDRYRTAAATLRIDHHMFCETMCDCEVVDTSFESCCGLVTQLSIDFGWTMPATAAQALYTGLVTDSGRFRYDSTNARTFALAQYLLQHGVDVNTVYGNLYADDYDKVKLRAQFVLRIQFTPHHVAYIYTPQAEWQALGLDAFTTSRGMVGTMADLKGVPVWINLTQTEQGILCELRSSVYNINEFAVRHGGGGHAKACGCTVATYDEAMQLLAELDDFVSLQAIDDINK